MFGGFTSQATNLIVRSIAEVAREGTGKGRLKKLGRTLFSTVVVAPLMAAAVNVLKGKPYAKDDDELAKDLVIEWAFQIMGYPFFVRDVTGNIRSLVKYNRAGGTPVSDVATVFYELGQEVYKLLQGKSDGLKMLDKTAEFVSLLSGMPYTQPRSLSKMFVKMNEKETKGNKGSTPNVYR